MGMGREVRLRLVVEVGLGLPVGRELEVGMGVCLLRNSLRGLGWREEVLGVDLWLWGCWVALPFCLGLFRGSLVRERVARFVLVLLRSLY
jgi:hypothetical protein